MPLNYGQLTSMKFEPARVTCARKDTILHALGVGIGALDPCDPDELKYLYEKQRVALPTPTLAVTLAAGAMRLADPAPKPRAVPSDRPPGLQAKIWKQGPGNAALRLIANERGLVVEDFGRVEWAE